MTMEEAIKILQMQEEILQFTHFTNADAWELGCFLVSESKRRGLTIGVMIQLNNGVTVFQHLEDGITLDKWKDMQRKAEVTKERESSSLRSFMEYSQLEESLSKDVLSKKDPIYGGSFPIRIEEVGVIGSLTIAGLDHVLNHDFLVKCISKYLHVDEIPRISIVTL